MATDLHKLIDDYEAGKMTERQVRDAWARAASHVTVAQKIEHAWLVAFSAVMNGDPFHDEAVVELLTTEETE